MSCTILYDNHIITCHVLFYTKTILLHAMYYYYTTTILLHVMYYSIRQPYYYMPCTILYDNHIFTCHVLFKTTTILFHVILYDNHIITCHTLFYTTTILLHVMYYSIRQPYYYMPSIILFDNHIITCHVQFYTTTIRKKKKEKKERKTKKNKIIAKNANDTQNQHISQALVSIFYMTTILLHVMCYSIRQPYYYMSCIILYDNHIITCHVLFYMTTILLHVMYYSI